ncbi:MAG: HDIG domain-containing protein [Bacteroidales bacterium]|nr:HDIG domain-containing protein [Bacteroidales bacterium]
MQSKLNKPHSKLYKPTLIFVVAGLILLALFPKEAKFKFEFVKGKPWQHEQLIAPFSFAIQKTDEQIKNEEDSIKASHPLYFKFQTEIGTEKRLRFKQSYFANDLENKLAKTADSLLKKIYQQYIIDPIVLERLKQAEIVVVKNKESNPVPLQWLRTPKKIYLELIQSNNQISHRSARIAELLNSNYQLENFITNNIDYDEKLTEQLLNQKLSNISNTKGMIQKGELIISRGEIINDNDYEILRSFRSEYELKFTNSGSINRIIGNIFLIAAPLSLLFMFLFLYRKKVLLSTKKIIFILGDIVLFAFIIYLNNRFQLFHIYLLPVTILPILVRAFFDTRLATFVYMTSLLLMAYLVPNSYEFVYIQLITGMIAVFSLVQITKRSHIFRTASIVFIVYVVTFIGLMLIQEDDWHKIPWEYIGLFAGNSLMISLSYPIVYLLEKLFGFTSDVTLLELSDTNQPLLKKLSEKAPGTFQHSLQVANIAEEIIRHIGGNPLLVRTGALYHDIGKMKNPGFFTENQSENYNPHKGLSCIESAKIIIQHIPDGITIAKKYQLPQSIVDFIPMHQGTLTTQYFINTYKQQHPGEIVDETLFSYPGPKPFSKETAAVMMADSIEAASRSLLEYTHESIKGLVDKIIDYQFEQRQFENVNLTFKDLSTVKTVLVDKLSTIYHTRIAYPEEK